MGAILILVLPTRRYLKRTTIEPGIKTPLMLVLLFGFMKGTAAGSGMSVIAFFNSTDLSGPLLLGTDAIIGLFNELIRFGAFYTLGLLDRDLILFGLFMTQFTFPRTCLASRIVDRMGNRLHNDLLAALIAIAGILFVARGVTGVPKRGAIYKKVLAAQTVFVLCGDNM